MLFHLYGYRSTQLEKVYYFKMYFNYFYGNIISYTFIDNIYTSTSVDNMAKSNTNDNNAEQFDVGKNVKTKDASVQTTYLDYASFSDHKGKFFIYRP